MKNEHGIQLDRNGYAPSIVQDIEDRCERCGCGEDLVRHEIFFGRAMGVPLPVLPHAGSRERQSLRLISETEGPGSGDEDIRMVGGRLPGEIR